jgi:hypothetical protein
MYYHRHIVTCYYICQSIFEPLSIPLIQHAASTATVRSNVRKCIVYANTKHSASGAYSKVIASNSCTRNTGSSIHETTGSKYAAIYIKCLYEMLCAGIRSGSIGCTTKQRWDAMRTAKKLAVVTYRSSAAVTTNTATMCSNITCSSAHRTGIRPRRVGITSPGQMKAVCSTALTTNGKIAVLRKSKLSTKNDPLRKILCARLKNTKSTHCNTFRETLLGLL